MGKPLTPVPVPAPPLAAVREFATCLSPADMTFEVASGLATMARCTAETACLSGVASDCPAFAKMSGRDEKYLNQSDECAVAMAIKSKETGEIITSDSLRI